MLRTSWKSNKEGINIAYNSQHRVLVKVSLKAVKNVGRTITSLAIWKDESYTSFEHLTSRISIGKSQNRRKLS